MMVAYFHCNEVMCLFSGCVLWLYLPRMTSGQVNPLVSATMVSMLASDDAISSRGSSSLDDTEQR